MADPVQDSENHENPDLETQQTTNTRTSSRDRIILINPLTQGMVVIEGSSSGLDSLLRDLLSKDGQPPASKKSIEAMPLVEIKEGEANDGGDCVICLEEWRVGDVAREMPCKHRFHGECVEKWLGLHGSCPVCRYKMPVDEDHDLTKKFGGEENERGEGGRGRRRGEIWVSFSFNSDERRNGDSSQTASSATESNDAGW